MRIGMRVLLGYFLIVAVAGWFVLSIFVQEIKPGVRRATEGTLIDTATLLAAHLGTGLLNAETLGFSAALSMPALAGLFVGYRVQDRLDQHRFRRWTQGLLVVTGLNMVRLAFL